MNYEIYCDESCWEALYDKDSHLYAAIGGVWIPAEKRQEVKTYIGNLKNKYGLHGEMKWNRICPKSVEMYKELVNYFFDDEQIRFRAICIKAAEVNHERFNAGNGELGFYKFYFQLIHHWMLMGNSYQVFVGFANKPKSKDIFSPRRAARMMWIKDVLADKDAKMYVGYDSKVKGYSQTKRVSVVKGDYVVVIQIYKENEARFITAFVADNSINKITSGPEWKK